MDLDFLVGYWPGFYLYGETYGEELKDKKIGFELRFFKKDGSLVGTCQDEDTLELFDMPANITEIAISNNTVSFVKQYPFSYTIQNDGRLTIDKSKRHPPIGYSGVFDIATSSFSGKWEMEIIELISFKVIRHVFSGKWFMQKR